MNAFEFSSSSDLISESPMNVSSLSSCRRRRWTAAVGVVVLAMAGLVAASSPAQAQACIAGTDSDFDGDGLRDLAIGDPDATVEGQARAGRVHIAYGDGTRHTFSQAELPGIGPEAGDRFGFAMDAVDWNGDGCSDLVVGSPFESVGGQAEAGHVAVVYGSTSGLEVATFESWNQAGLGVDTNSATDRFGFDIAAGVDTAGEPFIVAGMPGEVATAGDDVGQVVYIRPDAVIDFNQGSAGVPGLLEAGDLYGYAVAASPSGFVVGGPGEAVDGRGYAGMATVFGHSDATGVPPVIGGIDQETSGVSGVAEAGDMMGYAVAMVDYLSQAGSAPTMVVTVAAPGEDGSNGTEDSGYLLEFDADGTLTQRRTIHEDSDGVEGSRENGDVFGSSLAAVNTTPGQVASWEDLLVAVGAPGEDIEAENLTDRGAVQVFSLLDAPGAHDVSVAPELEEAGIAWQDGSRIGSAILAGAGHLYVADPWSSSPAVYAIPWENLTAGATDPVVVYTPADFGLDIADVASFGASLA